MVRGMFALPLLNFSRITRHAASLALVALLAACGTTGPVAPPASSTPTAPPAPPEREPEVAAFSALLNGLSAVPRSSSPAQGRLVAVLNRKTGLFRWKFNFDGLSGPVRSAHFHGPAMEDEVAGSILTLGQRGIVSPTEGRAMLTPSQRANLLAGQWYVNVITDRYPEGEIRGQLIEQY